jgi:putative endopeptidase
MDETSKKRAHKKLDKIRLLMGYPPKWHNLDKLTLENDNHLRNILNAKVFKSRIQLEKIGKKPDLEDWKMYPQTVNAYCDQNQLVLCFPAAILQPPFFDPNSSYAANLGGIGAVIGHEFTHNFDDQGSKFDENGNMNPWLSETELSKFKKLASNIVRQADAFEVLPGVFLKGELILGEVIADIGGLEIAIETLRTNKGIADINKSLRELFTQEAVCERGVDRDELTLQLAKTDPHPPAIFRVNCTVPHINAFYEAYEVTSKDKLYLAPEQRAHIW